MGPMAFESALRNVGAGSAKKYGPVQRMGYETWRRHSARYRRDSHAARRAFTRYLNAFRAKHMPSTRAADNPVSGGLVLAGIAAAAVVIGGIVWYEKSKTTSGGGGGGGGATTTTHNVGGGGPYPVSAKAGDTMVMSLPPGVTYAVGILPPAGATLVSQANGVLTFTLNASCVITAIDPAHPLPAAAVATVTVA